MSVEETGKYKGQRLGLFIFDCFMSALYLVFGIIVLFTPLLKEWQVHDGIKTGLGVLFGLYGIYRVARAVKRIFRKNY
jgi:hypothetical protein